MQKDERGTDRPWWITEGILDGHSPHEPISFMRRRGGCPEDIEEQYERRFSETEAKRLADAGYNFVETCFFKGLGLEAEVPEMERSRRFIGHLQKHGIKAGVYTQWGTLFNETFFQEVPEARDWVQIAVDGKPIEYGDRIHQYFRWRGCPGNPDFLAFIKKLCTLAIEDYGVDVVYFDNMCLFEGHDTLCYCEHCRRGFKEYLAEKFPTPESAWERFGLRRLDAVEPPPFRPWTDYTETARPILDPVMQEFIEFRCHQLTRAWREVWEHIHRVDPNAGMMGNPSFPRKYNERLTSAIDMWQLKDTPSFYYMENAVAPVGVRDGAVSSNAPGYKYGRALGVTFLPCGGSLEPGLYFCEGLAFNNGTGSLRHGYEPFLEFYRAHRDEFYRDVEPASDVAVLRHDVSLTWRWHETYTVMTMAQQQLLCGGVPWMPLWGQQLLDGTLDRYKVLVVPGCACLSRAEADAIHAFVEGGGCAVILENTGTLNERHQTLGAWRFARMFAEAAPAEGFRLRMIGRHRDYTWPNKRLLEARFGQGRAVYLPQVRASREPVQTYAQIGAYDGLDHLRLPSHGRALPRAVAEVAGDDLSLLLAGPETLFCEVLRKTGTGRRFVHLVNYASDPVAAGAELSLAPGAAKDARVIVPDECDAARPLDLDAGANDRASVRLPGFSRYALVVIE
jgi:hypothetical protein